MNAPGAISAYFPSLRQATQTGRVPFLSINHIRCYTLIAALEAHGVSSRRRSGECQFRPSWLEAPVLVYVLSVRLFPLFSA
jgi:hypothetical protein